MGFEVPEGCWFKLDDGEEEELLEDVEDSSVYFSGIPILLVVRDRFENHFLCLGSFSLKKKRLSCYSDIVLVVLQYVTAETWSYQSGFDTDGTELEL